MFRELKNLIFSKTAKNITLVYSADIFSIIIGFVIAIILIRGLSKFDYGLYTNFIAVMGLITGVIGSTLNYITVRNGAEYISIHKKVPSRIYGTNFLFQILLSVFLLIIITPNSLELSRFFFGSNLYSKAILLGGIAAVGFILIETARTMFQTSEKFKKYGILKIIKQLALLIGIFLLWKINKLDFQSVAFLWAGILFVLGTGLFFFVRKWVSFSFRIEQIKEFLGGASWLLVYFIFLDLLSRLGVFMLSKFRSVEEVAVYGVAFRYYSLMLLLLGSINAVFLPKLSKIEYRDTEKQKKFTDRWVRLSSLTIIPIGILAVCSKPLMNFLNGPGYTDSVFLFQLFCISMVISLMFSPIANILIARKEYSFLAVLGFVALVLNFIGNYLFIPVYGAIGATISIILSFVIINLSIYLRLKLAK